MIDRLFFPKQCPYGFKVRLLSLSAPRKSCQTTIFTFFVNGVNCVNSATEKHYILQHVFYFGCCAIRYPQPPSQDLKTKLGWAAVALSGYYYKA